MTALKKFQFSDNQFVVLKKEEMKFFENGRSRYAVFTYRRWSQFLKKISVIDECMLEMAQQQEVKLQQHIGVGWYVSVTSGFQCVNFRNFCALPGIGARFTKTGIALRLHELSRLKDAVGVIKQNFLNPV